jgi:hypothetical protein
MGFRHGWWVPATFALVALVVGCGGGGSTSSSGGASPLRTATPTSTPTPGTTSTPTPVKTGTSAPTAKPTSTLRPTPSPTPTALSAACAAPGVPVPGTYTEIVTVGNVSGTTYTQNAGGGTWYANAYATAPPTPVPTPTPTLPPTPSPSPTPTKTPKGSFDSDASPDKKPSPSPTAVPTVTPSPIAYTAYSGSYALGGFSAAGPSGTFAVSPTYGCVLLLATLNGQPVLPGGNYNASAQGNPNFEQSAGPATQLASGAITAFTISNITPVGGNGTFTLSNNVSGTVTIQTSQVIDDARLRQILGRFRTR